MNTYWVDINGDNESFWEHEWGKHGTCMSTLKPTCIASGGPDAVAYFSRTVGLFKTLPTYEWLASQGITPSTTQTYTLSQLTSALKAASGYTPALDCSGSNINQIYWYFNLKGSVVDGEFVPINAPIAGSCGSSGLKYPPKTGGGTPTTTSDGPAPTGLPTKATIKASSTGCLLSYGTWSTQTCATFTLAGSGSGFTLTSSKGSCGVSGGSFSCGTGLSSTFTATTSGSQLLLAYSGSTAWTSDAVPSGTVQQTVYTGSSHASDYTLTIVAA
jgi:ribonuclease T2